MILATNLDYVVEWSLLAGPGERDEMLGHGLLGVTLWPSAGEREMPSCSGYHLE